MNNIAIILDSTSGHSKEWINKHGGFFIPIIVDVDGKSYKANENINSKELESILKVDSKVKTAAATMGSLKQIYDDALKHHSKVIYISISKGLSSTNETAKLLARDEEYKDKVFVYDSEFITPWIFYYAKDILEMAKSGKYSVTDIFNFLDMIKPYAWGYLVPGSLKYLYNGGRITKVQYVAANLFNVVPIIWVRDGRIDQKSEKVRTIEKTVNHLINNIEKDIQDYKNKGVHDFKIGLIKATNIDRYNDLKAEILRRGLVTEDKITDVDLSPEIVGHTGAGYWGIGILPMIDYTKLSHNK